MLHTLAFPTSRSGVLFARSGAAGPPPVLPAAAVAVVGSRRADPRALEASRAFAAQAHAGSLEPARSGFCVVSGLALGCDSAAHSGCIAAGGVTVAVLPCGLDRVAPRSNAPLADRILTSAGLLASEYPLRTPPANFRFVQRNRIIAALSQAVVVMDAQIKSGTLHTARFALEQNKPLACFVPEGKASPGCLHLVRNCGATPLSNPEQLRVFLAELCPEGAQL